MSSDLPVIAFVLTCRHGSLDLAIWWAMVLDIMLILYHELLQHKCGRAVSKQTHLIGNSFASFFFFKLNNHSHDFAFILDIFLGKLPYLLFQTSDIISQ